MNHPIRTRRLAAGLTQTQLAEEIGVGRVVVIRWELGKTRPHRIAIRAVAAALGTDPESLAQEITAWPVNDSRIYPGACEGKLPR